MMLTGARPSIFFKRWRIGRRNFSYFGCFAHIVDGEDHHGLDPFFAYPLRRDEAWKAARNVKGIVFIEVREPIGVRRANGPGVKKPKREYRNPGKGAHWEPPEADQGVFHSKANSANPSIKQLE
jgi:hypothetical protein